MPDDFNPSEGSEVEGEDPFAGLSSYGRDYLSRIEDENERNMLMPHIKGWDKGASQKFEEYAAELKGYKNLGSPDQLQMAMNALNALERNPTAVFQQLIEGGYVDPNELGLGAPQQQDQNADEIPSWFQERFNPIQEQVGKLSKIEEAIGLLAQNFQQMQSERQQQQEEAQLASTMEKLTQQFPGAPEPLILAYMQAGMDPQEAGKKAQRDIYEAAKRPPAPNVLGPGGIPKPGKSPTEMTPEEAKAYAVAFMQAQNQG